jgi:hypothetical protein
LNFIAAAPSSSSAIILGANIREKNERTNVHASSFPESGQTKNGSFRNNQEKFDEVETIVM